MTHCQKTWQTYLWLRSCVGTAHDAIQEFGQLELEGQLIYIASDVCYNQ